MSRELDRRLDRIEEGFGGGPTDAEFDRFRPAAEKVMQMPEAWPAVKAWGDWLAEMRGGRDMTPRQMLAHLPEWRRQDPRGFELGANVAPFMERAMRG
jgi:hypothetical protein